MVSRANFIALAFALAIPTIGKAQTQSWIKLDVPYVGTPPAVVDAMLTLAGVGAEDTVYDLGSGDGRIIIAAVRDRGAKRGVGIELNPIRIEEATKNAKLAGVTNRVNFIEGDIFSADFSAATVVTMYLWDNVNLRLRPRLLNELAPGTRIVSHQFHMFDWPPDRQEVVGGKVPIYFWMIPAQVEGSWQGRVDGTDIVANLAQSFQHVSGTLSLADKSIDIRLGQLAGRAISIEARDGARVAALTGQTLGDVMTGTLTVDGKTRSVELVRAAPR